MDEYNENYTPGNEAEPLELDDILDSLDGLNEQERDIVAERKALEEKLAEHRPEVLQRIVDQVQRYLEVMGGTADELREVMPFLKPEKPKRARAGGGAGVVTRKKGGWLHKPTGIVYKGGKLPNALAEMMVAEGVNLDDKTEKREWFEANCEKVTA